MKLFKNILITMIALVFATACDEGIDPITAVKPGVDETAPVIKINYPTEGTIIKVLDLVTSIDIDIKVTDDIEIGSISVLMDGTEIANFTTFTDYRIALEKFTYDNVATGNHIMTVTATDLEGKSTTSSVNFSKEPPYTPLFEGEVFYMPFDGDYYELVNIVQAAKVGSPGFAGESLIGTDSYSGTTNSYLTYPIASLLSSEFTAAFWYKVNPSPDRAGILVVGDDETDRNQGFRLFREGNGAEQRIKLNVGIGTAEVWNDGDIIDVAAGEWVHVAFTISQTQCTIFFNGVEMRSSPLEAGIDWTGCETLTIGAGGETFSYWNHLSDNSAMDELRLFNKALTAGEIQDMINVTNPYEPKYGETFYMPFDGDNTDLISYNEATVVGTTGFAGESALGSDAFAGATDSYLTFPTEGLFGEEFSTVFWYKVNPSPDRAGILVVGNNIPENRNQGFRLFREGSATEQRIKLNVGTETAEVWNDGGVIDATAGEWVQIAVTVSLTKCTVYFNGVEMLSSDLSKGIDWTGCTTMTIGAGGETFSYWNHLSDSSFLDELRIFNTALSQEEIQTIYDAEK
ncbi:LamG domain-containing protein [Labilibaculum manganireducens]|uniref:LamG domain-containing protein n=1 Tax=Labilibaculum manganireducens TaxID=1940525 RepID=UPI0029F4856C|nr:LamG domain-containing protein [Labilibaculum manganireducens]